MIQCCGIGIINHHNTLKGLEKYMKFTVFIIAILEKNMKFTVFIIIGIFMPKTITVWPNILLHRN